MQKDKIMIMTISYQTFVSESSDGGIFPTTDSSSSLSSGYADFFSNSRGLSKLQTGSKIESARILTSMDIYATPAHSLLCSLSPRLVCCLYRQRLRYLRQHSHHV